MFRGNFMDTILKVSTSFAVGFTTALFIEHKFVTLVFVEGSSMSPTLNPETLEHGDLCLVWRWRYKPARGDIVCINAPNRKGRIVKRIIGTEGDIVMPRESHLETSNEGVLNNHPIIIPKGHIWVEGDLGSRSLDSNIFGPVPEHNLIGVASRIVLPQRITKERPLFMRLINMIPDPSRLLKKEDR